MYTTRARAVLIDTAVRGIAKAQNQDGIKTESRTDIFRGVKEGSS